MGTLAARQRCTWELVVSGNSSSPGNPTPYKPVYSPSEFQGPIAMGCTGLKAQPYVAVGEGSETTNHRDRFSTLSFGYICKGKELGGFLKSKLKFPFTLLGPQHWV